jgi:hypothetical protein
MAPGAHEWQTPQNKQKLESKRDQPSYLKKVVVYVNRHYSKVVSRPIAKKEDF